MTGARWLAELALTIAAAGALTIWVLRAGAAGRGTTPPEGKP